jgi:hypothetical protein
MSTSSFASWLAIGGLAFVAYSLADAYSRESTPYVDRVMQWRWVDGSQMPDGTFISRVIRTDPQTNELESVNGTRYVVRSADGSVPSWAKRRMLHLNKPNEV